MKSSVPFLWFIAIVCLLFPATRLHGQADPGRKKIGTLDVTIYYATNGDPTAAGERAEKISSSTQKQLSAVKELRFTHYRALGAESQTIFRSYENWAQPLKPSDEILLRFETRLEPTDEAIPLNLELWLSRKKTLKTDVSLKPAQPIYVAGPEWRGGLLIIAVELAKQP